MTRLRTSIDARIGALSHFAAKPLGAPLARIQERDPAFKPRGLWVSVDGEDDWESWCISEDFGKERLAVRHRVSLAADANVLLIQTVTDLDLFTTQYGSCWRRRLDAVCDVIDWRRVAQRYDGIVIAPYQWTRRLDGPARWHYGWDCASGCIWQPRAIANVEVLADLLRSAA